MKRTYECMLLLDNREVKQGWDPLKQTVTGIFEKHNAEIVSARRWDERRLCYPIQGQERGTYLLVYYNGDPEGHAAIRRDLELSEPVMRHMTTTCELVPGEAYEPEQEFDVTAIPDDGVTADAAAKDGAGEAKTEEAKTGEAKTGDAKTAEAKTGDAKTEEAKTGEEAGDKATKADAPADAQPEGAVAAVETPATGDAEKAEPNKAETDKDDDTKGESK